ncbi:prolyl oligopeptidase family serine peptidase, partial [Escherichia coli]|nr:prolyl oligopeptidase family serine peptidase [Escherichia coli]
VYVLIDAIDTTHRAHELPCNADFWLAVQQELLPQVKAIAPFSDRADRTVVAGQSFGGLSALYAGLHWPERFGCVLSQSGSYWWPHRGGHQEGMLLEQLKTGE